MGRQGGRLRPGRKMLQVLFLRRCTRFYRAVFCRRPAISGGLAVAGGPDLDRLTLAEYDIVDGSNEVFAIDDLRNRDMVNVADGNNVDYIMDANTNVLAVCEPPLRQTGKPSSENAPDTVNFPYVCSVQLICWMKGQVMKTLLLSCLLAINMFLCGCFAGASVKSKPPELTQTKRLDDLTVFMGTYLAYVKTYSAPPDSIDDLKDLCSDPRLCEDLDWSRFVWGKLENGRISIEYNCGDYSIPITVASSPTLNGRSEHLKMLLQERLSQSLRGPNDVNAVKE